MKHAALTRREFLKVVGAGSATLSIGDPLFAVTSGLERRKPNIPRRKPAKRLQASSVLRQASVSVRPNDTQTQGDCASRPESRPEA